MLTLLWVFVGFLVGLLIVSVFQPPLRKHSGVPTPRDTVSFRTETGCVRFKTEEVPCSANSKSLNFVASQHK
jgi:hypothetical protein